MKKIKEKDEQWYLNRIGKLFHQGGIHVRLNKLEKCLTYKLGAIRKINRIYFNYSQFQTNANCFTINEIIEIIKTNNHQDKFITIFLDNGEYFSLVINNQE